MTAHRGGIILLMSFWVLLSAASSGMECRASWHHKPANWPEQFFMPSWSGVGCSCMSVPATHRAWCSTMDLPLGDSLVVSVREWYIDPASPTGQRSGQWFAPDLSAL